MVGGLEEEERWSGKIGTERVFEKCFDEMSLGVFMITLAKAE